MVIVDTTVWVDYLRGNRNPYTDWLNDQMSNVSIGLTDLILCEVLQGITKKTVFDEIRDDMLRRFSIFDTGGSHLAIKAAQNYQELRVRGFTVRKTIDCLIATFCLSIGYELLHNDRDFDAFESELNLKVVHP